MSATGIRLPLDEAQGIALGILAQINGEAHVVGSVRRLKSLVGDIEIAVHVDAAVDLSVGEGPLLPGAYETVKGGGKRWKYWQLRHVAQGYVVDLFRFDDMNRGSIMLIRTGPRDFSRWFVTAMLSQGLRHEGGYVRQDRPEGCIVPCPTEREAFALAGMTWTEPENRE